MQGSHINEEEKIKFIPSHMLMSGDAKSISVIPEGVREKGQRVTIDSV